MPNDPMEAFRKIQEHLETLRRMQNLAQVNVSSPHIDASNLRIQFNTAGGPAAGGPTLPEPLVDWLLEDLAPRAFHDFVTETIGRQKTKGYRPGHVPRPEGLKLLKKRYGQDPVFQARVGGAWLQGRKKEDEAFRLLKPAEARKDPWPVIERFGFPLAVWLFALSGGGAMRPVAFEVLRVAAAKGGKLEELLAAARKAPASTENVWALPEVSHDDEIARIQAEVEQILAERDHWKKQAAEEKARREKLESDLAKGREEIQRASQQKTAAEHARQALETKVRELERHLESLRDAEGTLKRLEKKLREMEHDAARQTAERETARQALGAASAERDALKQSLSARERTLRFLSKAAAGGSGAPYRGEVLLLVMAGEPAPYFDAAKRLGLTLLVHDGAAKTPQFDRSLSQAWRVLAMGEGDSFHENVRRGLDESAKPVVWLPVLPAEAFERLLGATRSLKP